MATQHMLNKYPREQKYKETENGKEHIKKYNRTKKREIITAYGGKCECCGEERFEFLCIDHVNGNGNQDRKIHGKGNAFYLYLIREGFPKGHRVLCHNCNMSIGSYGYCPHHPQK